MKNEKQEIILYLTGRYMKARASDVEKERIAAKDVRLIAISKFIKAPMNDRLKKSKS